MRYLSLFSGIEAATAAWHPLGWECVAVAEVEPFPCAVLAHHYPEVPNLGDVTKITEEVIAALGHIDVVVFGSPCQDLSVAGKGRGFTDEHGNVTRSGLFHTAMQIVGWARKNNGCRFALWENVPGAFSCSKGRDFATVVELLAGLESIEPPPKGWGTEGCAIGDEAMVEWATLDAQWFGVAQRRRRVFALADFGDWAGRPPILLEPQGVRGNTAPRREAGQAVAPTIRAGAANGGAGHGARSGDSKDGLIVAVGVTCVATGQAGAEVCADVAPTLNCNHEAPYAAYTLRANYDASEDGTGRGAPLVPVASYGIQANIIGRQVHNGGNGLGFSEECSPTLTKSDRHGVVAFGVGESPDTAHCLRSGASKADKHESTTYVAQPVVAFVDTGATLKGGSGSRGYLDPSDGNGHNLVGNPMQVRRLTPRECERLQGFPDDFTLIPVRGKPAADGPRYKALGNSMAVPVMRWIGEQIDKAILFS